MKRLGLISMVVLLSLGLNFIIFIVSYNQLAFPYLHESQRMENAPLIFSYVLAGFFISAVISTIIAAYVGKKSA